LVGVVERKCSKGL
jgi:hypothetical protein